MKKTAFDFEKGPVGKTEKFCEKTEQIQDLLANQWSKVCILTYFGRQLWVHSEPIKSNLGSF